MAGLLHKGFFQKLLGYNVSEALENEAWSSVFKDENMPDILKSTAKMGMSSAPSGPDLTKAPPALLNVIHHPVDAVASFGKQALFYSALAAALWFIAPTVGRLASDGASYMFRKMLKPKKQASFSFVKSEAEFFQDSSWKFKKQYKNQNASVVLWYEFKSSGVPANELKRSFSKRVSKDIEEVCAKLRAKSFDDFQENIETTSEKDNSYQLTLAYIWGK